MNQSIEEQEDFIIQFDIQKHIESTSSGTPAQKKKRKFIDRKRGDAKEGLMNDYFVERPLYPDAMFQRSFRMNRSLFLRIVEGVTTTDPYFQQRPNALGELGASPIQKCTAALRMLAYGTCADAVDEYIKIGESTERSCLLHFA